METNIHALVYNASTINGTPFFKNGASDYVFGALFIALAIAIACFYPKTKSNAKKYKEKQMIEYKKQNPKSTNDYDKTGMFLPPWERTKLFAPVFFAIVFIIIGISFMIGQPIKLWVD